MGSNEKRLNIKHESEAAKKGKEKNQMGYGPPSGETDDGKHTERISAITLIR